MTDPILSKYDGLRKLESQGLPRPDWRFFSASEEMPSIPWATAEHGWTVRSCTTDSYEFGMPSTHYCEYSQAREFINVQNTIKQNPIQYVVYPSWLFFSSGCVRLGEDILVEAVSGSLEKLVKGQVSPDLSFKVWENGMIKSSVGEAALLPGPQRAEMIRSVSHLSYVKLLVLEWSVTDQMKLFFHDWIEFG